MTRSELNHEDYVNLRLIRDECDRYITRTCALLDTIYPDRPRTSRDTMKRILINIIHFVIKSVRNVVL